MEHLPRTWQTYEQVARAVLTDLRETIGIADVAEYSDIPGSSGTTWRVEGTAIRCADGAFLIVECRRHTTKGLSQELVGGLAYRIGDIGAGGAILVTPLPLQKGGALVARANSIEHIILEPWSTSESYLATFMGRHFHRVTASSVAVLSDLATSMLYREGKLVE